MITHLPPRLSRKGSKPSLRTERNVVAKKPNPTEQAPSSDSDTVTDEQIAARAYEISQSEDARSDEEKGPRGARVTLNARGGHRLITATISR